MPFFHANISIFWQWNALWIFCTNFSNLQYYKYNVNTFPPTHRTRYTLRDEKDFNYFFWNDDKIVKDGPSSSAATSQIHAKAALVYNSIPGYFLFHSIPRFPTRTSENIFLEELSNNTGSYGQAFLCISVDKEIAEINAKLINCVNVCINKSTNFDRVNSSPDKWI